MSFLDLFSTNEFVHALGWTILHSIWQIAIISLLLGIVLLFMKRNSSSSRYYASTLAMFLVIIFSIITFTNEYSSYQSEKPIAQDFQLSKIEQEYAEAVISDTNDFWKSTYVETFRTYFERNLPFIVVIWYLIVLVLLLRTIGGLAYSQRLKSYKTSVLPEHWEAKLAQLAHLLRIKRSIQILESALIKVPVVIGYFKPVILMPLGIVSGLSNEQIEAILAHELAHIKRNDYLVNIFQSIIEVLFFYHPAIWWISKNIRSERENACDDIALLANINRKALAKALTNLEVLNQEKTMLALAFSGNNSSLLNRVKRILNPQKTKITMKEGFIIICILLASFSIMSFSMISINSNNGSERKISNKAKQISTWKYDKVNEKKASKIMNPIIIEDEEGLLPKVGDTIVTINQKKNIIYQIKGIPYRLDFDENVKLIKFSVKGKEIPKENWKNYEKIISEAMSYFKWTDSDIEKQEFELQQQLAELDKQKQELIMQKEELEGQKKRTDAYKKRLESYERRLKAYEKRLEVSEKRKIAYEERKQKEEMARQEREMIEHEKQMRIHEHKMQIVEGLIEEMKKDGLIDKDAISYKIKFNENELIINGKKQSKKVHEKYKRKFHEKAKGMHKLDVQSNANSNYYNKSNTEVLKMQLAAAEKGKQKLMENLKKLEIRLKELTLKKEVVQNESGIKEEEKKQMLEKIIQHLAEIKRKKEITELKMKQLVIEYEQIRKESQEIKE